MFIIENPTVTENFIEQFLYLNLCLRENWLHSFRFTASVYPLLTAGNRHKQNSRFCSIRTDLLKQENEEIDSL